ncbi:MAG TPA: hypothetical protein VK762_06560 [Polyangiaceae bacterium]|nr:hypothetical protein [Polyangiaceae bacterium]
MRRLLGPMALLGGLVVLAASGGGCSRGSAKTMAQEGGEAAAIPATSPIQARVPAGPPPVSPAVFSAPIAAARTNHQFIVAGLVAAEGVVRVMSLTAGQPAWTVDAVRGVSWAADAALKMLPAGDGVALEWQGVTGGKAGATLLVLGSHGERRGEPVAVGAGWCTTANGIAWLDPRGTTPLHVRARAWSEAVARDVATLSPDRSPTLLCGDHDAFVLGEGDDDLTAIAFTPGEGAARPSLVAIRDRDFGDDDEREHEAFTIGDDLGIVRAGGGGTMYLREVSNAHASLWHRFRRALSEDDDIALVDGDGASTFVVYTREAGDECAGGEPPAPSVRALRIDRQTADEATVSLAPADCDSTPGPFWIADAAGSPVVAWTRRRARPAANAAPIDSLVYRVFPARTAGSEPAPGDRPREGHVDVDADALVEAGCDEAGCFAAALIRAPDNDGGRPEPIVAVPYPQ